MFQREMYYTIVRGNEQNKFELSKKHGVWALHFRRRLKQAGTFDLVIHGIPDNSTSTVSDKEVYEKPLTLRVRIVVEE